MASGLAAAAVSDGRLRGPEREGIEQRTGERWDRLVMQHDEDLRQILGMPRELLEAGVDLYLNVNNHCEDCAPLTIERTETMI